MNNINALYFTLDRYEVLRHSQAIRQVLSTHAVSVQKRCILLAAMPKSGSTFLSRILLELTGYHRYRLMYSNGDSGQNIYLPNLLKVALAPKIGFVSQQHLTATPASLELINIFGITPIVTVRNIFDVVASLHDFLTPEIQFASPEIKHAGVFGGGIAVLNESYFSFDDETKIDLIIDLLIPWFFNFYASWYDAWVKNRCRLFWLNYDELIENKAESVRKVIQFLGLSKTDDEIQGAIERAEANAKGIRFNKGIRGRGHTLLKESQINRISGLAHYYPWVDFSRIGIPRSIANYE